MVRCKCGYSKLIENEQFREGIINGYEPKDENPWVYVPREPATFGHLIVVSGKCYSDMGDKGLLQDTDHMKQIMNVISELALLTKQHLKCNAKKCERVYVVSECDTPNLHLHFHLIPRFLGDKKGHMFLFERELEEARWKLKTDIDEDKIRDAYDRIGTAESILSFHKNLIRSDRWLKSNPKRKEFIGKIKSEIEGILIKKLADAE